MKKKNNEYLNEGIMDVELAAEQEEIKSRSFKYGTLATVFVVIFIVALVVINVFVGYLTDRFVLEIDLTSERLFEISEDTKEVIAGLQEDITITVLAEETTYRDSTELLSNIYEVLQRYVALAGGRITVRYINPNLNPGIVSQYNALGDVLSNDIIIESARRFKRYSPQNFYTAETDSATGTTYYVGLRAEQRLTSALLFVTSEEISKAAYVIGHGEGYRIVEMDSLLNYANYEITTVRLLSEDIPEDVSLLIIHDPKTDFHETEIAKLDEFFNNGGDAIIAMANALEHPNLDIFFMEWGVRYMPTFIHDTAESMSGYPFYVYPYINTYDSITGTLNIRNQRVMIPSARPIVITGTETGSHTVTALLESSESSYAKSLEDTIGYQFEQGPDDASGPFNMMVLSERYVSDKNLNYVRSSVIFTSSGFETDSVLKENAFLNRTYLGSLFNYVAEYTEGRIIPDKTFTTKVLTITSAQASYVFWIIVIGLPLAIIVMSTVIWARRRHL